MSSSTKPKFSDIINAICKVDPFQFSIYNSATTPVLDAPTPASSLMAIAKVAAAQQVVLGATSKDVNKAAKATVIAYAAAYAAGTVILGQNFVLTASVTPALSDAHITAITTAVNLATANVEGATPAQQRAALASILLSLNSVINTATKNATNGIAAVAPQAAISPSIPAVTAVPGGAALVSAVDITAVVMYALTGTSVPVGATVGNTTGPNGTTGADASVYTQPIFISATFIPTTALHVSTLQDLPWYLRLWLGIQLIFSFGAVSVVNALTPAPKSVAV